MNKYCAQHVHWYGNVAPHVSHYGFSNLGVMPFVMTTPCVPAKASVVQTLIRWDFYLLVYRQNSGKFTRTASGLFQIGCLPRMVVPTADLFLAGEAVRDRASFVTKLPGVRIVTQAETWLPVRDVTR